MSTGLCSVRLTRRYRATIEEVWDALVDGRWLGTDQVTVRVIEEGRRAELVLPHSVAHLELTSEGDETVIVLDHQDVQAPIGMRAMRLWTNALERLENAL